MAEPPTPQQRIAAALDRIERASARRTDATAELERRHATLRARIGEAIGAIDQLLAREGGS